MIAANVTPGILKQRLGTGVWACIIPYTWLSTTVTAGDMRAVELVD